MLETLNVLTPAIKLKWTVSFYGRTRLNGKLPGFPRDFMDN